MGRESRLRRIRAIGPLKDENFIHATADELKAQATLEKRAESAGLVLPGKIILEHVAVRG